MWRHTFVVAGAKPEALRDLMTTDDFRRIVLSMPGAEELTGMGYPNFRAERKSFATIEDDVPVIRLTRDQQARFITTAPEMFSPVSSGWGLLGSTIVRIEAADEAVVRDAVTTAWRNVTNTAADSVKITDVACVVKAVDDVGTRIADVDDGNVPSTTADVAHVAADAADVANVPAAANAVHDAKVADADAADVRDTCNVADVADAAGVANVAVVSVADTVEVEPRDDLQSAIERLQTFCGKEPAR
jgi:hypothetical protein